MEQLQDALPAGLDHGGDLRVGEARIGTLHQFRQLFPAEVIAYKGQHHLHRQIREAQVGPGTQGCRVQTGDGLRPQQPTIGRQAHREEIVARFGVERLGLFGSAWRGSGSAPRRGFSSAASSTSVLAAGSADLDVLPSSSMNLSLGRAPGLADLDEPQYLTGTGREEFRVLICTCSVSCSSAA